ncbi:MAG: copper chaperone PCu(A)C [Pseudomonadota bacterium]
MVKATLPLLAALLLGACNPEPAPLVTVNDARVTALPTSAAVYFTLANSGGPDRLLAVEAAGVGRASLHETSMDGAIMRMRAIDGGIEIPAKGQVQLAASGKHVMIQDLAKPLAPGSSIRLTLNFERQGNVTVNVSVGGPR